MPSAHIYVPVLTDEAILIHHIPIKIGGHMTPENMDRRVRKTRTSLRACLGKLLRMFLYQNDWKMLPMEGYEALVGTAEYLRFDLAQGTVTVVKHEDLDEDWGVLSVTTSDKAVKIADLSEKDVDGVFYKAILKYAYAHIDDMVERTEKNKRAKVNDAVKKKIAELKKPAEKQAAQESKDSKKDNKKKKAD